MKYKDRVKHITERSWKYFQYKKNNTYTFYVIGAYGTGSWWWYKGNKWSDKSYSLLTNKREECLTYKNKKIAIGNFVNNEVSDLKYAPGGWFNLIEGYFIWKCVVTKSDLGDKLSFNMMKEDRIDIEIEKKSKLFNLVL